MTTSVNTYTNLLQNLSVELDSLKDELDDGTINQPQFDGSANEIEYNVNIISDRIIEDNDRLLDYSAIILNDDLSEIYKIKYLRNWGFFISLFLALYIIRLIKI